MKPRNEFGSDRLYACGAGIRRGLAVLTVASVSLALAACAAPVQNVSLPSPPSPPKVIAFGSLQDLATFELQDRDDLAGLVKMGIKLGASHPAEARKYFLLVADKAPASELATAALAAAAMTAFNAGDRDGFLALLPRLEAAVGAQGGLAPSEEVADLIALGRFMRGDRPVNEGSPRLRRLLDELDRTR